MHADEEDFRGAANLSWLIGRQLDRVGMAIYQDHQTIGADVEFLEALGAAFTEDDDVFQKEWAEATEGLEAGSKIGDSVRIRQVRAIVRSLVRKNVLLRAVTYREEDFDAAFVEGHGDSAPAEGGGASPGA